MTSPTTKKWADTPFKLITTPRASLNGAPETPALRNATEMALLHNVLLRGLNTIYNQADSPLLTSTPTLLHDFTTYCSIWSQILHTHHSIEETHYFPLLSSQSSDAEIMKNNHEEHETFLPGLLAFDIYIGQVRDASTSYSSTKLTSLIDTFGPALETHLHHEIAVLIALVQSHPSIDWVVCGQEMAKYSKQLSDRSTDVPFMIVNSDVQYEGGVHGPRFPPFPWFVGFIFRWVFVPRNKGAWRFASCDDWGLRRELEFV